MEDEVARDLMVRAGQGDLQAFAQIVEAWQGPVLRVVQRYVGRNAADAEDLAQDVFIRAFKARERYRPEARFATWLFRIVANLCLNYLRDQKRRRALSLSSGGAGDDDGQSRIELPAPASENPASRMEASDLVAIVQEAIARLPDSQRMAIILSRYEEMSHADVALNMGLTEKGVKSLLFRARENLRRYLEPHINPRESEHED